MSPFIARRRMGGGRRFVLAASQYVPVLGTAWDAGGAATGLAADGIEKLGNGGFETAGAGGVDVFGTWGETFGDGAIADEIVLIHSGAHAAKMIAGATKNTRLNGATTANFIAVLPGGTYAFFCWTAGDGTNSGRYAVYNYTTGGDLIANTPTGVVAGTYAQVVNSFLVPAGTVAATPFLRCPDVNGGIAYFDDVSVQQSVSIATAEAGPNHRLTQVVTMPGAGVVPFGNRSRYLDASNNWYWRITPGTAGTDLELVEVNAGVSTTRASADIDWTAGAAYTLTLTVRGNVYTALVDGVAKLSYTDATNFLISEPTIAISDGKVGNATLGSTIVEVL